MIIKRAKSGQDPKDPAAIRPPKIFNLVSDVIGNSVVVLDGPENGDILIKAEPYKRTSHFPGYFDITLDSGVQYTYYLVENVAKPNGICHGHSLLTVKEIA